MASGSGMIGSSPASGYDQVAEPTEQQHPEEKNPGEAGRLFTTDQGQDQAA